MQNAMPVITEDHALLGLLLAATAVFSGMVMSLNTAVCIKPQNVTPVVNIIQAIDMNSDICPKITGIMQSEKGKIRKRHCK